MLHRDILLSLCAQSIDAKTSYIYIFNKKSINKKINI